MSEPVLLSDSNVKTRGPGTDIYRTMALLARILAAAGVAVVFNVVSSAAQAQSELEIPFGGTTIGTVHTISVEPHAEDPSRFTLRIVA